VNVQFTTGRRNFVFKGRLRHLLAWIAGWWLSLAFFLGLTGLLLTRSAFFLIATYGVSAS
jgi:hypothetical protein